MRAGVYTLGTLLFVASAGFILQPTADEAAARASDDVTVSGSVPISGAGLAQAPEVPLNLVPDLAPVPPVTLAPAPEPPAPRRALRIALQAGHWKNSEVPDELDGLRDNGGTSGGGRAEWEVNLDIAERTAALLEAAGYDAEVLPATVPPRYEADLFISIHADGNNDSSVHGYRVAAPRRDRTGRAQEFANVLTTAYGEATGVRSIGTVTRRMTGYYAFNSRRYDHAIHPSTVGVIIETGFLTSPTDQRILVDDPGRAAQGIFNGVVLYLGPAIPEAEPVPVDSDG
jgi:N-acetylmuramoyl-L-alanine amidase